ncbi:MAG: hypothetical protein A2157_19885 [Deltaproteobacteria bacterium RBG_16_47_11]|nr:MAG: hypothetical protein A2157_19885 [Deltaproteobacteria bacterium RBG_16_47_11]
MKRKSMVQAFPACVVFLILLVLTSACAGPTSTVRTYSDNKLPESEVAVIRGWYYFLPGAYRCIDIYKVDDSYPKAIKVELLPGRHELIIRDYVIQIISPWGPAPGCSGIVYATINFEPGHEYKIKTLYKGILEEGIKIVDVTTGAIVFSGSWGSGAECNPL